MSHLQRRLDVFDDGLVGLVEIVGLSLLEISLLAKSHPKETRSLRHRNFFQIVADRSGRSRRRLLDPCGSRRETPLF